MVVSTAWAQLLQFIELSVFFRAPFMCLIFLFYWGINVTVFELVGLNYSTVLGMNRKEVVSGSRIVLTSLILLSILTFIFVPFSLDEQVSGVAVELYFLLFLFFLWIFLMAPNGMFSRQAQMWYIRRIYFVINPAYPVEFCEVFIADGITSLAKVWGDSELFLCLAVEKFLNFFRQVKRSDYMNLSGCVHNFYFPLFTSLPYLFRFYQCWIIYKESPEGATKQKSGWGMVKYFTSLPVIWLSALKRDFPSSLGDQLQGPWVFSSVVNCLYSFAWDVVLDWGLVEHSGKNWSIRKTRVYPSIIYVVCIIFDFFLRITWSLKLSSHLHLGSAGTTTLFEFLELTRRFLWNFLRIEFECIKQNQLKS